MKARNLQFQTLQKVEDLGKHYVIGHVTNSSEKLTITGQSIAAKQALFGHPKIACCRLLHLPQVTQKWCHHFLLKGTEPQ